MSWVMGSADFSLLYALGVVLKFVLSYGFLALGFFGFRYLTKHVKERFFS